MDKVSNIQGREKYEKTPEYKRGLCWLYIENMKTVLGIKIGGQKHKWGYGLGTLRSSNKHKELEESKQRRD